MELALPQNHWADVMEVIDALMNALNLPLKDIEERRQSRKNERGGFSQKIYCHEVFVSEQNQERLSYYKARPEQYPEIKIE